MPVVSSSYELDGHTQPDGRRYVRETHVLNSGAPVTALYLAAVGTDYAAVMAERAVQINEQLAQAEAEALYGS